MSAVHRSQELPATTERFVRAVGTRPAARRRVQLLLRASLFGADAAMLTLATATASMVTFGTVLGPIRFGGHALTSAALLSAEALIVWMPFLALYGLYAQAAGSWGSAEFSHVVHGVTVGAATSVMLRFLLGAPTPPRTWILIAWGASVALVLGERLAVRAASSRLHLRDSLLKRTLVVGTNSEAAAIVTSLMGSKREGFFPVGCLYSSLKDKLSLDYTEPSLPTLGSARDLALAIATHDIDTVVVVSSAFDHRVLERIIAELAGADVEVFLSSSLSDVLLSRVSVREVAGMPLIAVRGISLTPANAMLKRSIDVALSWTAVIVGMPVWLLIAAAIKLTSPGPVLHTQRRVGLRGQPFEMFKFRSMVEDAEGLLGDVRAANGLDVGPLFKLHDDPRVTPIGKLLRRFSADEFPQLLNVIRGEMSIVGPRPPLPKETAFYDEYQWRRLDVVPGMTGLWQVSGRSNLSFDEMVGLDLFYIGNWSVALDLSILARTVPAVLTGRGAC